MSGRKNRDKQGADEATHSLPEPKPAVGVLRRATPAEAKAVLDLLLEAHPELRPEAERLAAELVSSPCIDDIAEEVFDRVSSVDLDDVQARAGARSWGYVEPSEAAWELLEESLDEVVADMKRRVELGLIPAAEAVCAGIVEGLYWAKDTESEGALNWATEFPMEEAALVMGELISACPANERKTVGKRLLQTLSERTPEWLDMLTAAAQEPQGK